jgi:hypothetical protein
MEEQNNNKINRPIQDMVENARKDSTVGPMIGSVIVILIILVGGLYFLGSLVAVKKTEIETEQAIQDQQETTSVENTAKQSEDDSVSSIETDLKATDIDSLDKDFIEIEKEF